MREFLPTSCIHKYEDCSCASLAQSSITRTTSSSDQPEPKRGKRCSNFLVLFCLFRMKMLKLPLYAISPLGTALQRERKARQLSQRDLAQQALISIPTIHLLENGQGNLTSFRTVLHTLNLDIMGRNLPPGESMGKRVVTLRKRKGMSQRALASIIETTQPTLIALEKQSRGRLQTLDRALGALGGGAFLGSQDSVKAFFTHAGNSSHHH